MESIPTAQETPAFCQRVSKKEAEEQAKMETNQALTELGVKLQREISENKNARRNQSLNVLIEQVKLSEMLNEYFDLDETSKKARMLDLFTELNKLRIKNVELAKIIDNLNKKYESEKDMREEADDQLEIYDKEMNEMRQVINNQKLENEMINENQDKMIKEYSYKIKRELIYKNLYKFGFYAISAYSVYLTCLA